MRYANVLLILFLCAISFASESAPLRFAAAEMPKPDPCLPFITETYKWVEKHWPDGATFRYYDVTSFLFVRTMKLCRRLPIFKVENSRRHH